MTEQHNMEHLRYLRDVADRDVAFVDERDRQYGGSWKRSGGRSAWFMLVRKIDRLREMMRKPDDLPNQHDDARWQDFKRGEATPDEVKYLAACYNSENIFAAIRDNPSGEDGTVLAEIRDLRRYLLLVEAEMVNRRVLDTDGTARREPTVIVSATQQELKAAATPSLDDRCGYDGVVIRPGDKCTCAWPCGTYEKVFDTTLIEVSGGRPVVEAPDKSRVLADWKWLRKQPVEGPRVPRMTEQKAFVQPDDKTIEVVAEGLELNPGESAIIGGKKYSYRDGKNVGIEDWPLVLPSAEDGAQHASVTPHVVRSDYFIRKNIPAVLRMAFWKQYGPNLHVLEPHVDSHDMPRVLQGLYRLNIDRDWILCPDKIPENARDKFPFLPRELNSTELEGQPKWQHPLYEWDEKSNKWAIMAAHEKWTREAWEK